MNNEESVKSHYRELFGIFFEAIAGIDIKGLPAIHIPVIGNTYAEYRKIAVYGMETKDWKNMTDLKSMQDTGDAYNYLTEDFKSMKIFNNMKANSFFGFVIRFLASLYEYDDKFRPSSFIKNHQDILQSFIWGNINSFERRNMNIGKVESDQKEPDNWKSVRQKSKEIFDMHLFAATDKYNSGDDQLRYILESCNPEILLILYWDFNMGIWLEKNFNISWEIRDNKNHFCYAHIKTDKIDTHVYKCNHPNHIKFDNKNFMDIIGRVKNDFRKRFTVSFYKLEITYLTKDNNFILKDERVIKSINEDVSVFICLSLENEINIGFECKKSNISENEFRGLMDIIQENSFYKNSLEVKTVSNLQTNHIYKKFMIRLTHKISNYLIEYIRLHNCLYELERNCRKLLLN
jgi:hypothetical protein